MKYWVALSLITSLVLAGCQGGSQITRGISLLAGGGGGQGSIDGQGDAARFNFPEGLAIDASGNLYVADATNHLIRKITPGGLVSTLAGSAGIPGWVDGTGENALFSSPRGVAIDSSGNIFVSDAVGRLVRKITPAGLVTTVAGHAGETGAIDGVGSTARFSAPQPPDSGRAPPVNSNNIAVDPLGNIYVADTLNHTIRKILPDTTVTTLAGLAGSPGSVDGQGSAARFYKPHGIVVDGTGNIYVADSENYTIRKITPDGTVSTLAGSAGVFGNTDGTGTTALFDSPVGLAIDSNGNLYVTERFNRDVRKISPTGVVTTVGGFATPSGISVDSAGNLYVVETASHIIRKVSPTAGVTTLAGKPSSLGSADGMGSAASFFFPAGLVVDSAGNVFVADSVNKTIRKISSSGSVSTLAGAVLQNGTTDGQGTNARFGLPVDITMDGANNLYVIDNGNHTIRKITASGLVSTFAGTAGAIGTVDGAGAAARFNYPNGTAIDSAGNIYVADTDNATIRKITPAGSVTTIAGSPGITGSNDGVGNLARFNRPSKLAVDQIGNVYVSDTGNHTIRKIAPDLSVTTLAGSAGQSGSIDGISTAARFNTPTGIAVDSLGTVYVSDTGNSTIRQISPSGVVTTIAGKAMQAGMRLGDLPGRLGYPSALTIDANGVLYVSSEGAVLKISL